MGDNGVRGFGECALSDTEDLEDCALSKGGDLGECPPTDAGEFEDELNRLDDPRDETASGGSSNGSASTSCTTSTSSTFVAKL